MSVKAFSVSVPLSVGLPGPLAGAAAVPHSGGAVRAVLELLGEEGIAVEVVGADGAVARAAYEAARRLLERLGEEARILVRLEHPGLPGSAAAAAAAAARAVAEMLGVEPAREDLAEVLLRATALAKGRPVLPLAAASYLSAPAVASEQPAFMTRLPVPKARIYLVESCGSLPEAGLAVEAGLYRQLLQAATVYAAGLYCGDLEPAEAWRLLAQESPWDYAAASEAKEARLRALYEGAYAAGLDPYTGYLVVVAGDRGPAEAAAAVLSRRGCRPRILEAEVLGAGEPREEQ